MTATDAQVRIMMRERQKGRTQEQVAAEALGEVANFECDFCGKNLHKAEGGSVVAMTAT